MENQEEKELNNTSPKVVDEYITMDNGDELRVFKKADDVQMENKEEESSLKYYDSKVSLFIIHNRSTDAGFLFDAFEEAKKMYEKELDQAHKDGYISCINQKNKKHKNGIN